MYLDLEIIGGLAVAVFTGGAIYYIIERRKFVPVITGNWTPSKAYESGYSSTPYGGYGAYTPGLVVQSDSGYSAGLLMGSILSQPTVIERETTVYVPEPSTSFDPDPVFTGFGGGDSGGGGASDSWTPSCDSTFDVGTSCDASTDSSY